MENRTEPMQEQAWWKLHCASCLLVFCAVVWCCWCWLRSEWGKKKPSKPIHILTALFTTRIHKENKQVLPYQPTLLKTLANIIYCMCLFQHGKTGQKPCKNKHGENCIAQVVCWYFVRLCGAAGVGCEVSEGKKPSKPIHILTALFTTRVHKENKEIVRYQPTLLKTLANTILLYVSLSAWKRGEKLCKNKHGENCIAQVVCWYFVRLCGAAGVGCEVSEGKKNIQTYPYSNCTFHHQSSQRKQTSFTVPTNLGKTLANIICCMCFFQHNGKQDRTHARTNMVKIALRKLFAGILCGCVVLLMLVAKWVSSQRKQTSFTVPTDLGTTLANIICCMCLFQHVGKQDRTPCKNKHCENCVAQVVCWYFVRLCGAAGVGCKVSEGKQPSKPIHILTALFTTRIHKENKQVLPYQPTSGKFWPT